MSIDEVYRDMFWDSVKDIDDIGGFEFLFDNRVLLTEIFSVIGSDIVPTIAEIFNPFRYCPSDNIKGVILGQDPYPQKGKSMGAAFSLKPGDRPTKSLITIFKELEDSIPDFKRPSHGDLTPWMRQGILMMNTAFTTVPGLPGQHILHWEPFTAKVIEFIESRNPRVCYIIWGKKAQELSLARSTKKLISNHPAAFTGFLGNNHFNKMNIYLNEQELDEIDWCTICDDRYYIKEGKKSVRSRS